MRKGRHNSQNIQPRRRPRHTRPKAHRPITKTTQIHPSPQPGMFQCPPKHKPPHPQQRHSQHIHRNSKLRLKHPPITTCQRPRTKITQRPGHHSQNSTDQRAREEIPVLRDGKTVRRWGKDLRKGVGGADEEGDEDRSDERDPDDGWVEEVDEDAGEELGDGRGVVGAGGEAEVLREVAFWRWGGGFEGGRWGGDEIVCVGVLWFFFWGWGLRGWNSPAFIRCCTAELRLGDE